MDRASEWSLRVMHEASCWPENSFLTLTYGTGCLPPNGSLCHEDVQKFLKRVRKWSGRPLRFYMCGEYGPVGGRPHYHMCLFNQGFLENRKPLGKSASGELFYEQEDLTRLWGHGRATVQPLVKETAGYCARYIMKKLLGPDAKRAYDFVDEETGEIKQRKAEYAAMSLKPGIGQKWFDKFYGTDVFPQDFVIEEGVKRPVPKYYDKLFRRAKDIRMDKVEFERLRRAERVREDNTDERRRVREEVHLAKVRTLNRGIE